MVVDDGLGGVVSQCGLLCGVRVLVLKLLVRVPYYTRSRYSSQQSSTYYSLTVVLYY